MALLFGTLDQTKTSLGLKLLILKIFILLVPVSVVTFILVLIKKYIFNFPVLVLLHFLQPGVGN